MPQTESDSSTQISIAEREVRELGFTPSGLKRFCDTVIEYGHTVLQRSCGYADIDKAPGMEREVTHEHVRRAALTLLSRPKEVTSTWAIGGQISEYIFAAALGAGASNLGEPWGIVAFGLSVIALSILVTVRLNRK